MNATSVVADSAVAPGSVPAKIANEPKGRVPPRRDAVEEVRVAMALNGGVSLAVWMGGCAVELDAARRAHLGPEDLRVGVEMTQAPPPPGSERTIYHALCAAFDRELIIDLMSGSSAGGINGALLAAAIDSQRRLHPDYIREKWIRLGDFETLLHPLRTPAPTSLMGGRAFFLKLRRTFEEILPTREVTSRIDDLDAQERAAWDRAQAQLDLPANQDRDRLSQTVKLDVTATDVTGDQQYFRDTWGENLVATEYRQRFRFRARTDYSPQRLAMAARASASFPLAFEPWAVDGGLLGLEGRRWLIDGGLLDNAPIRAVLDLIPGRESERPVRRYLCYLNADPPLTPTFDREAELRDANNPAADAAPGKERARDETGTMATRPQLQDVASYVVGLPRKAAFIDQLRAIQRAATRSATVESGEYSLIALDEEALVGTAAALLTAYRTRRRLASLEELLKHPADVTLAADRIARAGGELPWIPSTLAAPMDDASALDDRWGWGARAAERVLHLMLDLIRPALMARRDDDDPTEREALVQARRIVYSGLAELDLVHSAHVSDEKVAGLMRSLTRDDESTVPSTLCALGCLMRDPARDPTVRRVVESAAHAMFDVRARLGSVEDVPVARALFGASAESSDARFETPELRAFLRRTLAMEVIRRAFTAEELVESDQPLLFAQLTPCAPTLIYTPWPLHPGDEVPSRPDDKLTGTRWGHFAAFYRASWRANDFMWGRLDAAVRIVDMLVPTDQGSSPTKLNTRAATAARLLADALAPQAAFTDNTLTGERRWLVAEALTDAIPVPKEHSHREQEFRDERGDRLASSSRDDLLATLNCYIEKDLTGHIEGLPPRALTRALCVRAAQWEILRRELPTVIELSKRDRALGTSGRPLDEIPAREQTWREGIETLRKEKIPLPKRLGVDDTAEQASALMLRTGSHGALVGLSALHEARLPGSPAFLIPRALLLPIAGMVARKSWPYPFAVALAFWSFALILAARLVTLNPGERNEWDAERWLSVATTWMAAGGVVMVCVVPFWRLLRGGSWPSRLQEAGWWVALAVAGGAAGIVLQLSRDGVAVVDLVAQSGSEPPWGPAAGAALLVAGVFRFVPRFVPGPARRWAASMLRSSWQGPASLALVLIPWILLGVWASREFILEAAWGGAGEWSSRDQWTARIAFVVPGLLALCYALFSVQRRGGTVLDVVLGRRD